LSHFDVQNIDYIFDFIIFFTFLYGFRKRLGKIDKKGRRVALGFSCNTDLGAGGVDIIHRIATLAAVTIN
jgi:hypothetical protein